MAKSSTSTSTTAPGSDPKPAPEKQATDGPARPAPTVLDRVPITSGQIQQWFEPHTLDTEQAEKAARVRQAAAAFAQVIKDNTSNCADQTAALRHVRDASATAHMAIALRGR